MTATATRRTTRWLEQVNRAPGRVDREKGIIYGVKVCGLESANGRAYTAEALRKAARLYEGLPVNVNHPSKARDDRASEDRFGKLVNVRFAGDGLYADLHFLRSHPMAERVMEAAERMPSAFGLSHNAGGKMEKVNGRPTVTEITEVRSVDLVADPATTRGLFESNRRLRQPTEAERQDLILSARALTIRTGAALARWLSEDCR